MDSDRPNLPTSSGAASRPPSPDAGHWPPGQRIAVVGSGISGLSAAWLLRERHRVTLFEADERFGGHSHTVEARGSGGQTIAVDTGFIVYNEPAYPNLVALFKHLGVATQPTDMSFGVSLDDGALEYAGSGLRGLFAQRSNLLSPRFWSMLRDLVRFYREVPRDAAAAGLLPLDDYLDERGYGRAFRDDHLYPMAAAIWSTPAARVGRYPTAAFVRFCENHHLLTLGERPPWRTVVGGSREYVQRLTAAIDAAGAPHGGGVRVGRGVVLVERRPDGVVLTTADGRSERFDHVVLATHADQALRLLEMPDADERRLLGVFHYSSNRAILHGDETLMPRRREVWSAWNYLADRRQPDRLCVTYWMNRLQHLPDHTPLFVTLNPVREPRPGTLLHSAVVEHPMFDAAAIAAQRSLWSLQGRQRTWFCGAWFGSGFHEDGLQAGLAVAEALGGVRRPWRVEGESDRIVLPAGRAAVAGEPAVLR